MVFVYPLFVCLFVIQGSVVINKNAQVQHMQDYRAHPFRFRVVCGETKNATEISAPSSKSREEWMDTIRLVREESGRSEKKSV